MRRRRSQAGITLIELLVVMVMTAILAAAIGYAFTAELTMQRLLDARRAEQNRADATEQEITRLLQGARLGNTTAAATTTVTTPGAAAATAATGATTDTTTYFIGTTDNGASAPGSNRLTFTTTAPGVPMASLNSTDDFETQQDTQGPVGGLAEVSLGTVPIGDAEGRTGLFERIQRPSDGDPTQGGMETDLDPQIAAIGFEFWDGAEWLPTWDTTQGQRQLPTVVKVSYTLQGDPTNTVHMFVVPILASAGQAGGGSP